MLIFCEKKKNTLDILQNLNLCPISKKKKKKNQFWNWNCYPLLSEQKLKDLFSWFPRYLKKQTSIG